jgi:hypothetical protein
MEKSLTRTEMRMEKAKDNIIEAALKTFREIWLREGQGSRHYR